MSAVPSPTYQARIWENPFQWDLYTPLADLYRKPSEQSHILLKGAWHALEQKEYKIAKKLSDEAQKRDGNTFSARVIEIELLRAQGREREIPAKLEEIGQIFEKRKLPAQAVKAYKRIAEMNPSLPIYQKVIYLYAASGKQEKVAQWTIKTRTWAYAFPAVARSQLSQPIMPPRIPDSLAASLRAEATVSQPEKRPTLGLQELLSRISERKPAPPPAKVKVATKSPSASVKPAAPTPLPPEKPPSLLSFEERLERATDALKRRAALRPAEAKTTQEEQLKRLQQLLDRLKEEECRPLPLAEVKVAQPKKVPAQKLPAIAFGKTLWARFFGEIGEEPRLPKNIDQTLSSRCPFWPDKKIEETHILVLVPATVDGKPLNFKTLKELVKKPRQGGGIKLKSQQLLLNSAYQDLPNPRSRWVLMTKNVLPGSLKKTYVEKQGIVAHHRVITGKPYEVPTALDATVCILMEYFRTGTRYYNDRPLTYTLCQEKYDDTWQVAIGCFSKNLHIKGFLGYYGHDGMGGMWKL